MRGPGFPVAQGDTVTQDGESARMSSCLFYKTCRCPAPSSGGLASGVPPMAVGAHLLPSLRPTSSSFVLIILVLIRIKSGVLSICTGCARPCTSAKEAVLLGGFRSPTCW